MLIGAGANRKEACGALSDFIQTTRMPFCTTQMGKGVVDERSDLCLGTAALSSGDYLHCAIERTDLIINVGHDVVEKPPFLRRKAARKSFTSIIRLRRSTKSISAGGGGGRFSSLH